MSKVGRLHEHKLPYHSIIKPLKVNEVYQCETCDKKFVVVPYGAFSLGWQPLSEEVTVENDDTD